jgi:hypothetical protein
MKGTKKEGQVWEKGMKESKMFGQRFFITRENEAGVKDLLLV